MIFTDIFHVIATIGPETSRAEHLAALVEAGVTAFRINLAHASESWLGELLPRMSGLGINSCPVIADLPGRKFRLGDVSAPMAVARGDHLFLGSPASSPPDLPTIPLVPSALNGVHVQELIQLADGQIKLKVLQIFSNGCLVEVQREGLITSRMGVVSKGIVSANHPQLVSDEIIRLCHDHMVKAFLISYCEQRTDLESVADYLAGNGLHSPTLIPKIETSSALDNLDELLECSPAICLARGDLGNQIGLSRTAWVEQHVLTACRRHGTPCLVAGQVLLSSVSETGCTRAELAASAYALRHGARGFILSEETAKYLEGISVVEQLRQVISAAPTETPL